MSDGTRELKSDKARCSIGIYLFVGFFALYMFTTSVASPLTGDGLAMVRDAQHILDYGFNPIADASGRRLSKYQLGQPLLNLIIVPFRRHALQAVDNDMRILFLLGVSALPAALGAVTCLLAYLCVLQLGLCRLTALCTSLLIGLTSMLWCYSQTLFSDLTLGMLLLLAFYGCLRFRDSRRWFWLSLAGVAAGYAVLTKITAGAALIVFSVYVLWLVLSKERRLNARTMAHLTAFGVPVLFGIVVMLWYNYIRFDHWLNFGYIEATEFTHKSLDHVLGFNVPLFTGLYGLLLSSGKGVLWYNPTLLLVFLGITLAWRRARVEVIVCVSVFMAVVLVHAKWWAWHGDWSWGPRFLIAGLPILFLPAAFWLHAVILRFRNRDRRWRPAHWFAALLVLVSLQVQFVGLFADYGNYIKLVTEHTSFFAHSAYDSETWPIRNVTPHSHYIPEFSPLIGHWWMIRCTWHGDSENGAQYRRRPPWHGLNPLWVPEHYNIDRHFHWHVWWAFTWQMREKLDVNMWLHGGLAGLFLVIALGGLGTATFLSGKCEPRETGDTGS